MNFINSCIEAAKQIKLLISSKSHEELCENISVGFGGDMSHFIDIEAEKIFIEHLSCFGQIYSEESGYCGDESENKIIIDPVDGSANFISKIPYYGACVALQKGKTTTHSFIVNFANDDIFFKTKNGLKQGKLEDNTFFTPKNNLFSDLGIFERSYTSEFIHPILQELKLKYRSPGAIALSLAYARNVDFVLYEGKIRDFDIVAGLHMCEDLYTKKGDNFLFVSKDKKTFGKICKNLLKAGKIL